METINPPTTSWYIYFRLINIYICEQYVCNRYSACSYLFALPLQYQELAWICCELTGNLTSS